MTRLTSLSRSVAGRRVLVTGAGSGMGRATAQLFADEGARVAVVDRVGAAVAEVVGEIRGAHGDGSAIGIVADLSLPADIHRIVAETIAALGGIDIVVNNAGVSMLASLFQEEAGFEDGWAATLDVNLTAYVRLVRAALPSLREAPGGGRVVNIASTEAIVATPGISGYSATKAGVTGLTRSMAVELASVGVTVNCVCPGPVRTGMTDAIPDEAKEIYARRKVPLRRYGDPEEVAHMTLSLCLPAAGFTTGATLVVDGGMTIKH